MMRRVTLRMGDGVFFLAQGEMSPAGVAQGARGCDTREGMGDVYPICIGEQHSSPASVDMWAEIV